MPPRRRDPRLPELPCAYRERGRPCPNPGTGNPPICAAHRVVIEAAAARERPRDRVIGVVADAVSGRLRGDQLRGAATSLLGGLLVELESALPADWLKVARASRGAADVPPPPPPPRRPPMDPETRALIAAVLKARRTLGFKKGDLINVETVEKRKRELARKHHPDLGGSLERMQEVNAAADLLLAELAKTQRDPVP